MEQELYNEIHRAFCKGNTFGQSIQEVVNLVILIIKKARDEERKRICNKAE